MLDPSRHGLAAETIAAVERDIETYNKRQTLALAESSRRLRVVRSAYLIGIGLVVFMAARLLSSGVAWAVYMLVAVLVFGGWGWLKARELARRPLAAEQQAFRDHMLPVLFGFVEDFEYSQSTRPVSIDRMSPAVVPEHTDRQFGDVIGGVADGHPFEVFEAGFELVAGPASRVMFAGVVLATTLERPFPGLLVIQRKTRSRIRATEASDPLDGLDEFRCGRLDLDTLFEFRSDAVGDARDLLGSGLSEALASIDRAWRWRVARLAISGSDLFVMLSMEHQFFELPPAGMPLDSELHIEPMLEDFRALLAGVDEVRRGRRKS